jgi:thioredoxin-like negative regulator of GroEL
VTPVDQENAAPAADELTPDSFESRSAAGEPVCALFSARWCAAGALLERQVRIDGPLEYPVVIIDVDEHPHLADRYRVQSLPSAVMFIGAEKGRLVGAFGLPQLRALMARHRPADTTDVENEKPRRRGKP